MNHTALDIAMSKQQTKTAEVLLRWHYQQLSEGLHSVRPLDDVDVPEVIMKLIITFLLPFDCEGKATFHDK